MGQGGREGKRAYKGNKRKNTICWKLKDEWQVYRSPLFFSLYFHICLEFSIIRHLQFIKSKINKTPHTLRSYIFKQLSGFLSSPTSSPPPCSSSCAPGTQTPQHPCVPQGLFNHHSLDSEHSSPRCAHGYSLLLRQLLSSLSSYYEDLP